MIEFSLPRKFSAESYCQNQVMLKERERDTPTKEREKKNPKSGGLCVILPGTSSEESSYPCTVQGIMYCLPFGVWLPPTAFPLAEGLIGVLSKEPGMGPPGQASLLVPFVT